MLHQRIEQRFDAMLEAGFVEEVQSLRGSGDLLPEHTAYRSVGYRQVGDYLDGAFDRQTMVKKGVAATRQLAKRQLTWLRHSQQSPHRGRDCIPHKQKQPNVRRKPVGIPQVRNQTSSIHRFMVKLDRRFS